MMPSVASEAGNRVVVGIAEFKVTTDPTASLVTYALGSCVAVVAYDPSRRLGGLIHYMLPASSAMPARAAERPAMFADTGVPALFHRLYALGTVKGALVVKVAGGGQLLGSSPEFDIGYKNVTIAQQLFKRSGVTVTAWDVGGTASRTVELRLATGEVVVRSRGKEYHL